MVLVVLYKVFKNSLIEVIHEAKWLNLISLPNNQLGKFHSSIRLISN